MSMVPSAFSPTATNTLDAPIAMTLQLMRSPALIPLGLGLDAMRQLLVGEAAHGLLPVPQELGILCLFAAVFLVAARYSMAYLEALSKREGRLTQRWQ